MNPYERCPKYETKSFTLRLVEPSDAKDLLVCYSDPVAVSRMNADNCTSDFYYTTLNQMQECISFWLEQYKKQYYVRFSIIPKSNNGAIGTIEIFGGEYGVLRIDLATEYEKEEYINEFFDLAEHSFVSDFNIQTLVIKDSNTPERREAIKKHGFVPSRSFRPEVGYYEKKMID